MKKLKIDVVSDVMSSTVKNSIRALAKAALCATVLFAAPSVFADAKTIKDGVFTQAQVDAGVQTYDNACKACHDMRFYRDTLKSWDGQPVLWMWETILGTMPADNPGSLMLEEYTDVVAYILSENGFPVGDTALDPDSNMADINIVAP